MPEDPQAIMKKAIDECKKQSIGLPKEPKNLIDSEVIARGPGKIEIHLAKRNNEIIAVGTIDETITKLILLDESALVGIIGWNNFIWEKILERLPLFRKIIDSESKASSKMKQDADELLEKAFLNAELEENLVKSLFPSEAEIQKARRDEYERGARWQINWDISAGKLKRAADHLLRIYEKAKSDARTRGNLRIFVEGGEGWEEHFDEQLIGIYYMLMGLSIENLFKGIIMVNHPEYLKSEGLEKISKHETYEFLDDPDLKDQLREFQKYKYILTELAEYVKWKAKYPVSKSYKDFEPDNQFIDQNRLIELYNSLSRRAQRERRLEVIRNEEKISIPYQEFIKIRDEINEYRTPSTKIKDIIENYPQWNKVVILHVLVDISEDLEESSKKDLKKKIVLYRSGRDV